MGKLTKNQKLAAEKIEAGKAYSLKEAAQLVKDITFSKFDASLDIDVSLGVDPRKANQMVRGVVSLPHGTGKQVRVLVLCTPDAEAAAKEAGADYVGLDEYIEMIMIGNIMLLIPGVLMTNSFRDFISGDMISGLLHFSEAIITAICIAAGFIFSKILLGGIL